MKLEKGQVLRINYIMEITLNTNKTGKEVDKLVYNMMVSAINKRLKEVLLMRNKTAEEIFDSFKDCTITVNV